MSRAVDVFLIILVVLSTAFYVYGLWDKPFIVFSSNILFPVCSVMAAIAGFYASKRYGVKSLIGAALFSYASGMLIWAAGEVLWAIYVLCYGMEVPFPSIADIFYVIGYIPLFMGFAFFMRVFRVVLAEWKVKIPSIVGGLIILSTMSLTIIPEALSQSGNILERALAVAYPLLDSILIALATISFMVFLGGRLMRGWLYVLLGFIFLGVVDAFYYYYDLLGLVWEGHPLEILWVISYIFLAKGFHRFWIKPEVKA